MFEKIKVKWQKKDRVSRPGLVFKRFRLRGWRYPEEPASGGGGHVTIATHAGDVGPPGRRTAEVRALLENATASPAYGNLIGCGPWGDGQTRCRNRAVETH